LKQVVTFYEFIKISGLFIDALSEEDRSVLSPFLYFSIHWWKNPLQQHSLTAGFLS